MNIFKRNDSEAWPRTTKWLNNMSSLKSPDKLDSYGKQGVEALKNATPSDTGQSARSWKYKIVKGKSGIGIQWYNDRLTKEGMPVVILLQYGHGTGTGGYVQGKDFINPTLKPIFDDIGELIQKEVSSG